jgi:hypothetical protein
LEIAFRGYSVWLRAWQVQVGRVQLYLLDSNDLANLPAHRGITSELYGGGPELRLKQELVLGIGGWRLLNALGIKPEVCHLNEGHAAFAVLERARTFMGETGQPFEVALAVTRAGNLFTTHTPVAAGFDRFSPALTEQYLGWYAQNKLGISRRVYTAGEDKDALDSFKPERPEDVERIKALQRDVHDVFIGIVKERRAGRLKGPDQELFSGAFWSGPKALELGLIDGVTDIRTRAPPAWRNVAVGAAARGSTLRKVTLRRLPARGATVAGVALKASATHRIRAVSGMAAPARPSG